MYDKSATEENHMNESGGDYKSEVVKAVGELAKTAYDDALAPVSKEVGEALSTLGRAINVALAPLRVVVWSYDQIEEYIVASLERKLKARGVPPERIQPPDVDVAVPAIEALRYSKLKENYANLLATAMDRNSATGVHPAFVEILRQLTPDEAKILEFLPRLGLHEPLVDLTFTSPQAGEFTIQRHVGTLGHDANCSNVELIPNYVDNLCRLGVAEVPSLGGLFDRWRYDRILEMDIVKQAKAQIPDDGEFHFKPKRLGLTSLGDSFRKACVSEP
jgi:hypothetical protein